MSGETVPKVSDLATLITTVMEDVWVSDLSEISGEYFTGWWWFGTMGIL